MLIACVLLALNGLFAANSVENADVDRAWTLLRGGIDDARHSDKRAKAARALGLLTDDAQARSMAEKALTDQSADVRVQAATALGQMHATASIPKLKEALKDKEPTVVLASANALYEMRDPVAYEIYYAMVTGQRKTSSGLVQSQLDMLRNRQQMEKLAFETGIGFVPFGGMALEAWKTITSGNSDVVLAQAIERLGTDPDPKSHKAIEDACYDTKWQVRAAAVVALAKRGDPASLDYVVSAMQDDSDTVEYEAAAATIHLSGKARMGSHRIQRRRAPAH
ncbi:MAG: HEAT repeat domain-containing protein [Acidobacteriaceae bacterium]|nr:HEAT repeat domain-containing protein [Acidobacteriaceae bacterium]